MMNRRIFLRNVFAGSAGLYFGVNPVNVFAKGDLRVTILHTNDIHCHIEPFESTDERYNGKGGLARIARYAKQMKNENPNTLLFDAGDMFQGTPYFNFYKGELILKTMTKAGYDAGTIGNHEFDNGLEGILNPLNHAGFPLICSNYDFSNTILKDKLPRFMVFNKSGIKIGVYGLGVELKGLVSEKNYGNTIYNDPLKTALEIESYLANEEHCDLVLCLSHLGLKYRNNKVSDEVLAAETLFTNLIIGGHTHTYLQKPLEIKNKAGELVVVNQAWWGGLMLGQVDFVFEEARKKSVLIENKVNN